MPLSPLLRIQKKYSQQEGGIHFPEFNAKTAADTLWFLYHAYGRSPLHVVDTSIIFFQRHETVSHGALSW